jgi:serine/threonine protein kinase/Tfp pilus assembly protein PilF
VPRRPQAEMKTIELPEGRPFRIVCAQCGSALSSSEGTEELCLTCLLQTALGPGDLNQARRSQRFDQYELVNGTDGEPVELGRGAMGVTYKAFDTNLRCEVALKVIHPRYLADEASRARFLSEARAAAQLRHRNIASVFHLGSKRGEYFYAMELVEGQTIEEWIHRKGPIDCPIALDIALQITRALIATGNRQFVHRDVKPSNVMLCSEADGAIVAKLIDFGLVRDTTVQSSPGRAGFIGTPQFASPEQFADKATDARSDIYSLGVTLWYMLSGKLPFSGTRHEIQRQQISGTLPLEQLKGISRTVVDLIKRMLEADPTKRPQSPEVLKQQLNDCITAIDVAKQKHRRRLAYSTLAAAVIITSLMAASYILHHKFVPSAASEVGSEKSIAVLPFQNLSGDPDNAYFADGIQEEILTRLAGIADLKVISRASTQRYQSKPRNLAQIAKELGVANIVEGSVQKAADQVRVNVQLINAQTDSHLWAETYDRKLTDIFGVESEIAKGVAESLQAKLTGREEKALAVKPTNNPEAYDAYLRGLSFETHSNVSSYQSYSADLVDKAIGFYNQAVQLDPNFAIAWARLSGMHALHYFNRDDTAPAARRNAAKRALENAQRLAPDSPGTLLALGYYQYLVLRDYGPAKATFGRVRQMLPGSSEVPYALGRVARREGHWDQSIAYFEQALALDPRNLEFLMDAAETYGMVRQFPAAVKLYDRVLDVTPNNPGVMASKAGIYQAQGNLQEAARFLSEIHLQTVTDETFGIKITQLRLERHYGEAVRLLQARQAQFHFQSEYHKGWDQVRLALTQRLAGDAAGAQVTAEQARSTLEQLYRDQPDNENVAVVLSRAHAALGEKNSALKEAERAITLLPSTKDAVRGPVSEENLALIQTIVGENSRAISTLTQLLHTPYGGYNCPAPITPALLRLDPIWDPLRTDPAFQKLCEEKQK